MSERHPVQLPIGSQGTIRPAKTCRGETITLPMSILSSLAVPPWHLCLQTTDTWPEAFCPVQRALISIYHPWTLSVTRWSDKVLREIGGDTAGGIPWVQRTCWFHSFSAIFLCFFLIYAVFSTVVSQLEGFGFDPQAILGGVSVFTLCLCRFAPASLHSPKTCTLGGLSTLHCMSVWMHI